MARAVEGAALLAGAVATGAAIFFSGGTLLPVLAPLMASLALGGLAMEAGAIAEALSSNRGVGLTTRQPAASRAIIYGEQRVGSVKVYESTTGASHDQYNQIIVIAGHKCSAICNLYLDGRRVYWDGTGPGYVVRDGFAFGGNADHNTHTDQANNRYQFGSLVYCSGRYGDQLPGDVIGEMTANDPTWAATADGSPYVGGCTYVYLKVEYDTAMFPTRPEIRFTVRGKNDIYDPRTGTRGYTTNWALIVNDVLTNSEFGLGEDQANVNLAQLIAAANVCDEQVPLANGLTEARYTINATFDTSSGPGDILASMMPAAQGRLSYIGGQWFIWPAYWQGPTASFGAGDLLKDFSWSSGKPLRERYNRVKGTYIAPNYPYQVAGNLYDGNGFYDNTRQDNFNFEWQRTDAPYYAQDALHGYSSDVWLTADSGKERWMDIAHHCCISVATCQRTFKIALLRNRLGGGSTTLTMSLAAYAVQPLDVIQFTYAPFGWTNKLFEVVGVRFRVESPGEGQPPTLMVDLSVQETDPSIYQWSTSEELTVTQQPASMQLYSYQVQPPSSLLVVANTSTALVGIDGVTRPQATLSWQPAPDNFVTHYQIQYQLNGSSTWLDHALVDAGNTQTNIGSIVAGQTYNFRMRSLTPRGAASAWVTSLGVITSNVYSRLNSTGILPGLIPVAPNNATIDSTVQSGGAAASVRVYGPGGVGTTFTQYLGGTSMTLQPVSFANKAFSTQYSILWDTVNLAYLITTGIAPNDNYIFIGNVTTVASGGTGGTSGGGGIKPYLTA